MGNLQAISCHGRPWQHRRPNAVLARREPSLPLRTVGHLLKCRHGGGRQPGHLLNDTRWRRPRGGRHLSSLPEQLRHAPQKSLHEVRARARLPAAKRAQPEAPHASHPNQLIPALSDVCAFVGQCELLAALACRCRAFCVAGSRCQAVLAQDAHFVEVAENFAIVQ